MYIVPNARPPDAERGRWTLLPCGGVETVAIVKTLPPLEISQPTDITG